MAEHARMTTRPPPFFIADHIGLDFLNTIAVPTDTQVEWLGSGADLLAWLEQAGLVPGDVLKAFRKSAAPGELDSVAGEARALRDWFKLFVYRHMGRPVGADALNELEPLNRLLAHDEEFGQIVARDPTRGPADGRSAKQISGLAFRVERHWRSPVSLLLPIARSLADLVCSEEFIHVKACEGRPCTLLFIDRTRGHVRRWCSMAVCGNRAKQAAHRERAQKGQNPKSLMQTGRR
jgi:predicted RNA-binding Zn ribbon-like protein